MRKLVGIFISLILITGIVSAYTLTVKSAGIRGVFSSEAGNTVQLVPSAGEGNWIVESGDVTITNNSFVMPENDVVIKEGVYAVRYNANGGGGAPANQIKQHGVDLPLQNTLPTRYGYTFDGWNTRANGSGTTYEAGDSYSLNENITLYAQWLKNVYTVSITREASDGGFVIGGGTKAFGDSVTLQAIPNNGYEFNGWTALSGGITLSSMTNEITTFTMLEGNVNIKATFTPITYELTINPGGDVFNGTEGSIREITAPSLDPYEVICNYNGNGTEDSTHEATRSFTSWVLTGEGSISNSSSASITYMYGEDDAILTANYETEGIILPSPLRSGHVFTGWYTAESDGSKVGDAGDTYIPTENITLYAIWEELDGNDPILGSGLTPLNWDTNYQAWVTTTVEDWDYNYDLASTWSNSVGSDTYGVDGDGTARWANAVITKDLVYYNSGNSGDTTTVAQGDIVPAGKVVETGSYFVWIPRFTYYVNVGNKVSWNADTSGTARTYIIFSNNTNDYTTDPTGETAYTYSKHTAFTPGGTEITGFWIAKYETSRNDSTFTAVGTGTTPTSRPNVRSWKSTAVTNMFTYAKDINGTNTEIGAHMAKNNEWGATAYLTSALGRIPYINNKSYYVTAYSGGTQNASASSTSYLWSSEEGVRASTTHNVYGIYDMSAGAYEYTATYYADTSQSSVSSLKTSYASDGDKYVECYDDGKLTADSAVLGWDSDTTLERLYGGYPVVARGGIDDKLSAAGIFYTGSGDGAVHDSYSFRLILFGMSLE